MSKIAAKKLKSTQQLQALLIFTYSDKKNPTKTTKSFDFCTSIKNVIILVHIFKEVSLYVALKAHKTKKNLLSSLN